MPFTPLSCPEYTALGDLAKAGDQLMWNMQVLYFGGGIQGWLEDLGMNGYRGVAPFFHPVADTAQRSWIVELDSISFTGHSMA